MSLGLNLKMIRKMKTKDTAKQIAFRDITEDCRKRKDGMNYLPFEALILASLGIPKPDFRQFNGGNYDKRQATI